MQDNSACRTFALRTCSSQIIARRNLPRATANLCQSSALPLPSTPNDYAHSAKRDGGASHVPTRQRNAVDAPQPDQSDRDVDTAIRGTRGQRRLEATSATKQMASGSVLQERATRLGPRRLGKSLQVQSIRRPERSPRGGRRCRDCAHRQRSPMTS